jgi:hypothetical protein
MQPVASREIACGALVLRARTRQPPNQTSESSLPRNCVTSGRTLPALHAKATDPAPPHQTSARHAPAFDWQKRAIPESGCRKWQGQAQMQTPASQRLSRRPIQRPPMPPWLPALLSASSFRFPQIGRNTVQFSVSNVDLTQARHRILAHSHDRFDIVRCQILPVGEQAIRRRPLGHHHLLGQQVGAHAASQMARRKASRRYDRSSAGRPKEVQRAPDKAGLAAFQRAARQMRFCSWPYLTWEPQIDCRLKPRVPTGK